MEIAKIYELYYNCKVLKFEGRRCMDESDIHQTHINSISGTKPPIL